MPLDLPSVNAVDAVWFVPADAPWQDRLHAMLREFGAGEAEATAWMALLERRARGEHDWNEALAGSLLANGRPCPPIRRYNDLLGGEATDGEVASLLVLRDPPLTFVVDVWGAGERGGEPGMVGLELIVHRSAVRPWRAGEVLFDGTVVDVSDPDHYRRMTHYGDAFARLMALGCERLEPVFALSDGMQPLGDDLAQASPERVRHPAPKGARLADYAWALAYWSPERIDEELRTRLERLELTTRRTLMPDGVGVSVRTLSTGGVFLQTRSILGIETRASRADVETPLARQLGLRSNHLLYKR